jgi:hypothetical protein
MQATIPRIANVTAIAPYALKVTWKGGGTDVIDMTGIVYDFEPFAPLRDPQAFAEVRKLDWGEGIEWPDLGLDFSADSLAAMAEEQSDFSTTDFTAWQEGLGLSNQEAADVLGVTVATIKNYRKGKHIPKATAIACRALQTNRVVFGAHYQPRKPGRPRSRNAA